MGNDSSQSVTLLHNEFHPVIFDKQWGEFIWGICGCRHGTHLKVWRMLGHVSQNETLSIPCPLLNSWMIPCPFLLVCRSPGMVLLSPCPFRVHSHTIPCTFPQLEASSVIHCSDRFFELSLNTLCCGRGVCLLVNRWPYGHVAREWGKREQKKEGKDGVDEPWARQVSSSGDGRATMPKSINTSRQSDWWQSKTWSMESRDSSTKMYNGRVKRIRAQGTLGEWLEWTMKLII